MSKDISVTYDADVEAAQRVLKEKLNAMQDKDCSEFHVGKIMFFNSTYKDVAFELVDVKGAFVCSVSVKAQQSAYINNIEMGEYYFRKPNEKKFKKKNMVNVVECVQKSVPIGDKFLK